MNEEISIDWLVGLGGQRIIGEPAGQADHVEFRDETRKIEVYPDSTFLAVSVMGKPPNSQLKHVRTRSDFAQVCRLFRFKIDGLEGGQ